MTGPVSGVQTGNGDTGRFVGGVHEATATDRDTVVTEPRRVRVLEEHEVARLERGLLNVLAGRHLARQVVERHVNAGLLGDVPGEARAVPPSRTLAAPDVLGAQTLRRVLDDPLPDR